LVDNITKVMYNWQCTDIPHRLISYATLPRKIKHFTYSILHKIETKNIENKELTRRINALFKRAYRYGFTAKIMEVTSPLDNASKDLFCNMQEAYHCLFGIRPAENEHEHEIRKRGHNFWYNVYQKL